MGPVQPPQRKGCLPQNSRNKLVQLQAKFDELVIERQGVFQRLEDIGITIEYLNPSFLVTKPSGGHRLVTAFAGVARYSKPQPSLMPDVETTLRTIARYPYLIVTDLTSAFYQIPLAKESMKYCGVATPFRGVRACTRCAMGMPGSETALEELMCRVLGDCLQDGIAANWRMIFIVVQTHPKSCYRTGNESLMPSSGVIFTCLHLKPQSVPNPPPSLDGSGHKVSSPRANIALLLFLRVHRQTLSVDYAHLMAHTKPLAVSFPTAPNSSHHLIRSYQAKNPMTLYRGQILHLYTSMLPKMLSGNTSLLCSHNHPTNSGL